MLFSFIPMQLKDQLNKIIQLSAPAKRIVSLVPSLTELLYTLGLESEVIGITKFCIHPLGWLRTKTIIGGTKDIKPDTITALQPDLIIASKEENIQPQVGALEQLAPVFVSDVSDLNSALEVIQCIGYLTGKENAASTITQQLRSGFATLPPVSNPVKAAYFIWRHPWMVAGGDTFINDMLQHAGYHNAFAHLRRYPTVDVTQLSRIGCKLILLSSEPYPFKEKHITEIQAIAPNIPIHLVDGEMFSWYGSRMLAAPAYFHLLQSQTAATIH